MSKYIIMFSAVLFIFLSCNTTNTGYIENDGSMDIHMIEGNGVLIESGIEYPPKGIQQTGLIVFVRGSGYEDMRDYFPGFFDTYLRDVFLQRGFAIVYHNKRGVGNSSGNSKRNNSFDSMAEDVLTIVDYYKGLDSVTADTVGVIGHSQGGWVVQRIAGRENTVDFAVSLMGPVTTLAEQDLARTRIMLECEGNSGEKLERLMKSRKRTYNLWRNVGGWFPYFELGFMHNVVDDSTATDVKAARIPLFLGYGGSDGIVPAEDNLAVLAELFPEGIPENITVLVAEDADHFLTVNNSLCNDYETIAERDFSQVFFNAYTQWLEANVF